MTIRPQNVIAQCEESGLNRAAWRDQVAESFILRQVPDSVNGFSTTMLDKFALTWHPNDSAHPNKSVCNVF
jgi:hypothetical protein